MVGKIILWVLLALLLLIAGLLSIPVKVRGSYSEGAPFLHIRYGLVRLQLFPRKEEAEKTERKPLKQKKAKSEKQKKPKKQKKPRAKINTDQILYALEKLPPILARALKRTGRSIHIQPLKLYVLVAGSDPAATAALYGRMEAALAAGFPSLERLLRLEDADVRLYMDFTQRKMDFAADVGVSLRPVSLCWIALRAGGSLLKWYLGFRKLASPPPTESDKDQKNHKDEREHAA